MVKGLATALLINCAQLSASAFPDATKKELSYHAIYPVLQGEAIAADVGSSLFAETDDAEFLSTLAGGLKPP